MKTLYNKGRFRSYEYAKHLRPFLKRIGNKKWRKTGKLEIEDQLNDFASFRKARRQKQLVICAKITKERNGRKESVYKKVSL